MNAGLWASGREEEEDEDEKEQGFLSFFGLSPGFLHIVTK